MIYICSWCAHVFVRSFVPPTHCGGGGGGRDAASGLGDAAAREGGEDRGPARILQGAGTMWCVPAVSWLVCASGVKFP